MGMKSCVKGALPFAAMVIVECGEVGMTTLGKAAMNSGMTNLVYVVYYNALGTLILFPYFLIHTHRSNPPPLTLSLLFKCFGLGLVGICFLQVFAYAGIDYSSPTLASAMGNLIPVFTFLLAIVFRMEKLDLRRSSSQAKSIGTIIAISGAFVMTLYKGPSIMGHTSPSDSPHQILLSQHSNWVLGGIFLVITCLCSSAWNIFQTATVKDYPDQLTVIFFFCFFGTIECAIFSLIVERNRGAWVLHSGIQTNAIVCSAIFVCVFRSSIVTWCLRKKGPVYVAMFKPMGMVIAVIMGILFLGDALHLGRTLYVLSLWLPHSGSKGFRQDPKVLMGLRPLLSVIGAVIIALGFYTVMWGKAKEKNMVVDNVCALDSSTGRSPLLHK